MAKSRSDLPNNTLGALVQHAVTRISSRYEAREAGNMAVWLMEEVLGFSRVDLVLKAEERLSESQINQVWAVLDEVEMGRPLQYVLGKAPFLDLMLKVDESVLIPRPETEELVAWAGEVIPGGHPVILDVGTGSGCIALGLKHRFPRAQVYACDVSKAALAVAYENARRTALDVHFFECNILEEIPEVQKLSLLVSNPPYIAEEEREDLKKHVSEHEPDLALFAGDDPLIFYRTLAVMGEEVLLEDGLIMVELPEKHALEVEEVFRKEGYEVEMRKDLQGRWRMLLARRV